MIQRRASTVLDDDFDTTTIDPGWQWPWDQASAPSVEPGRGGWLRLRTGSASMAIAARPTRAANYAATTGVDVASIAAGARAGLAAFGNRDNAIAVTVERAADVATGTPLTVAVWQTQKGERRTLATTQAPAAPLLHLRLSAKDRTRFEFSVSQDGQTWKTVGAAEGEYLPPWDLAVRVALLVSGPPTSSARFGGFKLESP
jgi:beta-xylosidase